MEPCRISYKCCLYFTDQNHFHVHSFVSATPLQLSVGKPKLHVVTCHLLEIETFFPTLKDMPLFGG